MQNFDTSFENITATMAQLRQAEADQPTHYVLCNYLDHGWEWVGVGHVRRSVLRASLPHRRRRPQLQQTPKSETLSSHSKAAVKLSPQRRLYSTAPNRTTKQTTEQN